MARFADSMPLTEALAEHFRTGGFGPDGGYSSPWVTFKIGPLPLAFPNIAARRRVVRFHDVHHVLTEYRTDLPGEMEIGAWEIATGCKRFWVAWLLNLGVLGVGALLQPRRTFRAWCRGRRARKNFFLDAYEPLLDETVGTLRARVGLDEDDSQPTLADRLTFAFWAAVGLGLIALEVAIPIVLAVLLFDWLV